MQRTLRSLPPNGTHGRDAAIVRNYVLYFPQYSACATGLPSIHDEFLFPHTESLIGKDLTNDVYKLDFFYQIPQSGNGVYDIKQHPLSHDFRGFSEMYNFCIIL